MILSSTLLADALGISTKTLEPFNVFLGMYMPKYDIDTNLREAAFLAQIAHESGRFYYTEEIATGKAYEGRESLGNTHPGDGPRYKGRGLIQLTGRANYQAFSDHSGINFISRPELLATPQYAVMSACWFWKEHGLNFLADTQQFDKITKIINGGYNGKEERREFYNRLLEQYD